ncbi:hypothetical protein AB0C12_10865 [Actinoplanes sp. NPDC048967]|uniref:hypothetical protein n=1 Tax=Actinoplanes sp. NPDC048967 TaxID=3155269 RepID=UPI0033E7955C
MSARHRLLLPVAGLLFALTACGSTPAPIAAAPPSTAPTTAAPTTEATKVPDTKSPTGPVATEAANGVECPPAKTLERVARDRGVPTNESLPENWNFVQVKCWKDWATAGVKGPNTGDGVYLFQYRAGSGWRYHSQGSGYHCEDLGIKEDAPFCDAS